ncbi:sugar 3,4-ketoisomerase [Aliivibrio fischeri]|uniref:WxcM-like domain-containing protein n=1 Tax=Aliivibrio fischeri TaxID=668 RepID=A0A844NZI9_ALIFS|nr:FdtA/QdtA family cupin domain-containing protein [Aliivibrio fischeri]MUK49022.1 WxcM-like domain-containing protein [Aliivibrio fischeri]
MNLINLIEFDVIGDERGNLVVLEGNKNIPFDIKRIYYLYGMKNDLPRGFHAHKKLLQVAVCISGSCKILMDNGVNKEVVKLNSPKCGLLIDKMQWHEMFDFSDGCILMVMASDYYDESDYIRDYKAFLGDIK